MRSCFPGKARKHPRDGFPGGGVGALRGRVRSASKFISGRIRRQARFLSAAADRLRQPQAKRDLIRRGLRSLRSNGVRLTWQKVLQTIYRSEALSRAARQPLFSEAELSAQREHRFPAKIRFSIIVPVYNTPERFLREMIESVRAQTYADWELCLADGSDEAHPEAERICRKAARADRRIRYRKLEKNLGISANTNACLAMAEGDYIALLDHDDLLHPAALYEVMRAICRREADFIYTDESTFRRTPEDAYQPHFKPDYAPDTLCGNNYICHFTVFRRSLLEEVGLFDPACDGSQDHDMVLRLTEKARQIVHIPEILYYWRAHPGSVAQDTGSKPYVIAAGVRSVEKRLARLGLEGTVSPVRPGLTIYRVRYKIRGTPKVSILIPSCEHLEDLKACLGSIFRQTTWPDYEIVIAENNSRNPALFAYYGELQREKANVRVVSLAREFNYSAVNNYAAQFCRGDYLLLLNNDTEVLTPGWIEEMLMFAQRRDVGAVGAMLYYPEGTIQHAGVGLGLGGVAAHFFAHVDRRNAGYMGRLLYAQDLSAVTGACLMIRRGVWDQVRGLDERFAIAYNDVDLCMRIRQAGYRIVWTPFARLYHWESKSRGCDDSPEKQARFRSEAERFRQRWRRELAEGDPYYNPNFALNRNDFSGLSPIRRHDARQQTV